LFDVLLFSQISIDEWHDLIGDLTYGDAILDRNMIAPLKLVELAKKGSA
jgi:hypothetical protein